MDYIEVTSPAASKRALSDVQSIVRLGLKARIVAHVRCHPDDIDAAIRSGVHGINLFFGTSSFLREAGHGRSLEQILDAARAGVQRVQAAGLEVRFCCEDSFRTSLDELLPILRAVDAMGVQRIGVADTVGIATPRQVYALVSLLRNELQADIEFHGHNDSGCAIANAYAAIEAGARYIDTTVLGIGERNGITSLEGLVARLAATDPALLGRLRSAPADPAGPAGLLDHRRAHSLQPHHRRLARLLASRRRPSWRRSSRDPRSYEALDPAAFGAQRRLDIATRPHRPPRRRPPRHRAGRDPHPRPARPRHQRLQERAARQRLGHRRPRRGDPRHRQPVLAVAR